MSRYSTFKAPCGGQVKSVCSYESDRTGYRKVTFFRCRSEEIHVFLWMYRANREDMYAQRKPREALSSFQWSSLLFRYQSWEQVLLFLYKLLTLGTPTTDCL